MWAHAPTLPALCAARVAATAHRIAYSWPEGDHRTVLDWAGVAALVTRYRAALAGERLETGARVAICARNRVEWVLFEQAALGLGLVVVPLFFNDRPDNLAWCLEHSGSRLMLIEDGALWQQVAPLAPTVRRAVQLSPPQHERAVGLEAWLAQGTVAPDPVPLEPQALATIVYTSGTTGRPKGVMLSHDNILANVRALLEGLPALARRPQTLLSFLPLSHMLERTVGEYVSMAAGWEMAFGGGVQTLAQDLLAVRPTLMVSVPRVFERFYQRIEAGLGAGWRRTLFRQAAQSGWRVASGGARGADPLVTPVLDLLVGRRIRALFGGRLRAVFLGGAPMPAWLIEVFTGLGLTFIQGYGLTETAPVATCNRLEDNEPHSVGRALPGVALRIDAEHELWVRGPNVMLGYWRDPEATRAAVSADGWFRTGDLGRLEHGRLYLSGRRKEIIVLSNGEKAAPHDIEQAVLTDTVFVQVLVVGEGRPWLALLAVSSCPDPDALLERANRCLHAFPGYLRLRRVIPVRDPWTVENGLLTPTLKLRRHEIEQRYASEINAAYAETPGGAEPPPAPATSGSGPPPQ